MRATSRGSPSRMLVRHELGVIGFFFGLIASCIIEHTGGLASEASGEEAASATAIIRPGMYYVGSAFAQSYIP